MEEQPIEVFARPGRVKWFDTRKDYGFIEPAGAALESGDFNLEVLFVHYSVIEGCGYRSLHDGQAVRFDAVRTDEGWKATRVERVAGGWPDDPGTLGVGAVPKRPPGLL